MVRAITRIQRKVLYQLPIIYQPTTEFPAPKPAAWRFKAERQCLGTTHQQLKTGLRNKLTTKKKATKYMPRHSTVSLGRLNVPTPPEHQDCCTESKERRLGPQETCKHRAQGNHGFLAIPGGKAVPGRRARLRERCQAPGRAPPARPAPRAEAPLITGPPRTTAAGPAR